MRAHRLKRHLVHSLAIFSLLLGPTWADKMQLDENTWVVGVPTEQFVHFAAPESAGRQQQSNWCWAACIQMVLNYHGLYVNQQQIVQRVFGQMVDRPGNGQMILAALSGWQHDMRGGTSRVYSTAHPDKVTPDKVLRDLEFRWPLIAGLRGAPGGAATGHAYVVTAAYYTFDMAGQPRILRVVLRDPWPTNPSRQEIDARDFFSRLEFLARVYVERG